MAIDSLTGKRRFRMKTRWFFAPVLVLQVEEQRHGDNGELWFTQWRDARIEDQTTVQFEHVPGKFPYNFKVVDGDKKD